MLGQGDEQGRGQEEVKEEDGEEEEEKERREDGAKARERWGHRGGERVKRKKAKAKELEGKEALGKTRKKKGKRTPDTAFSFSCPFFPWSKVQTGNKFSLRPEGSCCWPGLCLLPGSQSELGVGCEAAMGAGDLPQEG